MSGEVSRHLLVFKSVSDKNASLAPDWFEKAAYAIHFALHQVAGKEVVIERGAVSSSKLHRVRTATDVLALSIIGTAFLFFNLIGFILLNFSKTHKVTYLAWCGFRLIEKGKLDKAQENMRRALDLNPSHSFALGVQAVLCQRLGKNKEAEEAADKALKLDKNNLLATGAKAHVMVNNGKYDDAIAEADKILDAFVDHVEAQSVKAEAYYGKGEWDKTIEIADKILKKNPRIADPHTIRAKAFRRKYEVEAGIDPEKAKRLRDEAWSSIREALKCDQKNTGAMVVKAVFEAVDGNIKEAKRTFLKVQVLDPENRNAAHGLKILSDQKGKGVTAKHFQTKISPAQPAAAESPEKREETPSNEAEAQAKEAVPPAEAAAAPETNAVGDLFRSFLNNSTIRRATSIFFRTPSQEG